MTNLDALIHRAARGVALLSVAAALALPSQVLAQVKVGFVNVPRVLDDAPQAEAARKRIEQEFAPRDRKILAQQKEIRALEDRLVKNAAVMSEGERQRQEGEIRTLNRELRRLQDEFREDLNLRRSQELGKLQTMVQQVIQAMAKAGKYDLIFADGVVYAGDKIDITDQVIGQLRKEFKGGN